MKLVKNKLTGKTYCLHCKMYDCICLPESDEYINEKYCTEVEVKQIIEVSKKAVKLIFYKQTLPNGRIIKSDSELIVPLFKYYTGHFKRRRTILLSNDIINKSFY